MSRRNQARRRRAYAKRQHEVRERRTGHSFDEPADWLNDMHAGHDELAEQHGLASRQPDLLERRHGGRAAA